MGIALVSPVGSNGRRRSALGRVMLLSGATAAAVAAPILVSLRHHGPSTTTVITGDPVALAEEVGLGPLLDRRWAPSPGLGPVADGLPDAVAAARGFDSLGGSEASSSKPSDGRPRGNSDRNADSDDRNSERNSDRDSEDAMSGASGCGGCDADGASGGDPAENKAPNGPDGNGGTDGNDGNGEAAPAPITVVHPTTTRPAKVTTTPTTGQAGSATSNTSSSTTDGSHTPGGSADSTSPTSSTTSVTSTEASTTTTVAGGSGPETMMLPAVPVGGEVVEHRLEFSGGILWLRVSSSGLTLLDVVAKDPFGVDNVSSEGPLVRVRFRSERARQEILAEFLVDGRTRVTATTGTS